MDEVRRFLRYTLPGLSAVIQLFLALSFTDPDLVKKLFSEKGFLVSQTPLFNEDVYSGKIIRERINNNENWKDLVPNSVIEIIKKIDGEQRVKNL